MPPTSKPIRLLAGGIYNILAIKPKSVIRKSFLSFSNDRH